MQLRINDTLLGLILPAMYSSFGILLMRRCLHGIPGELVDAGVVDGASNLRMYGQITTLTRPAVAALAIFTFMAPPNAFLWPPVVIDSRDRETLPLVLAKMTGLQVVHYSWQMAAAVLSVVPVVIFCWIFQRNSMQGIALTGIRA